MQLVFPNPVRLANAARQQNVKPTTALLVVGAAVGAYFLFFRKPKAEEQPMSGQEGGYSWTITAAGRTGQMFGWAVLYRNTEISSGTAASYQEARDLITHEISELQAGA